MRKRSGFGWVEFLIGILMIGLGIFTFVRPLGAITGFVILYGFIAIVSGICDIVFYIKTERYTGFGPIVALIAGILGVMAGIMLLVSPSAGRWVMALLFPVWFIAHCISHLAHLNVIRAAAGKFCYYFSLVANILGLVLGILMLFQPVVSLLSVGFIIGFYLIMLGVDSIVLAFSKIGSSY